MTIKLTKDEKRNGWTAAKLEEYHKEREKAAHEVVFKDRKRKPATQQGYNPLRWR